MNRTLKTGIDRVGLIAALALLCSVLGFSTLAQTDADKPMTVKSLAALVEELKGVVAKTEPDANKSALVAEKWNKRRDLAGKTKKQVINLLYEDVKSVITDSGTQYEINTMFSFYKTIPDEALSIQAPVSDTVLPKSESVKKLVDLTFRAHPYVGVEAQLATLPGVKDVKAAEDQDRKNRIEAFDAVLKLNNKLTPDQKSFVKANYDRLIKITDKITEDAINKNFPTEQWINEGLQQSYNARFSNQELANLIAYFQGTTGQQVLKYVRISKMADLITGNGGKLDYTAADKAEYDKFTSGALGKKFITAYIDEAEGYEARKEEAARTGTPDADGFAIYRPENLNKLFSKFVAENYKK